MGFISTQLAVSPILSQDGLVWAEERCFWALVLLPLFGVLFFHAAFRQRKSVAAFVGERLSAQLVTRLSPLQLYLRMTLLLLAYSLMIVALARPQWGYTESKREARAGDIVFLMDTSRSMLADDVAPNRLERARLFALDLIPKLQEDYVGIVAVAGRAYVMAPLTTDHLAIEEVLGSLDTTAVPRGGTSFAHGLRECQHLLRLRPGSVRAIVFLTDGEDLEEGALEAVQDLAKQKIILHAVAFGTSEGSQIPVPNETGEVDFVRDSTGHIVHSRLNLAKLQAMAAATGGMVVQPLQDKSAMLRLWSGGLSQVSKTLQQDDVRRVPVERFQIPLGIAVLLLVIFWFLPGVKRVAGTRSSLDLRRSRLG